MGRPVPSTTHISRVAVVVPARDEEDHIGPALSAIRRAADLLQTTRPDVSVSVIAVLDSCRDNTAMVMAETVSDDARFVRLPVHLRSAGASRAAGALAALFAAPEPMQHIWFANTDADSVVPPHWLCGQLELADTGADAVLGTVEPDPGELDPALLRRWLRHHPFVEDHKHVYGANLGVRASAYLNAGGFDRVKTHEDWMLVDKLWRVGAHIVATDQLRVLTSGRLEARAPMGFAAYLRSLGEVHGARAEAVTEPAT